MSGFTKEGLVRNYLAGRWSEGDNGSSLAVEDPGNQDHVADCAIAGEASLAQAL